MNEPSPKYLIIAALFIAVIVVVTVKDLKTQKQAENFPDDSIIGKGKPVLLELGAHWCAPCRQMMPILKELAAEQKVFTVAFLNVETTEEASQKYGVEAIPLQIFFDADGKELFRHVGFYPKEDILGKWKEFGIN